MAQEPLKWKPLNANNLLKHFIYLVLSVKKPQKIKICSSMLS